jgi:hypothetical protein
MSWYIFVIAGVMVLYTVIAGGVDTGWQSACTSGGSADPARICSK